MSTLDPQQPLEWYELEAILLWRARGVPMPRVAAGMGFSEGRANYSLYRLTSSTLSILSQSPAWRVEQAKQREVQEAHVHPANRYRAKGLEVWESQAIQLWLQLGFRPHEIAIGMRITEDEVVSRMCQSDKAAQALKKTVCWQTS